ncbi:WYL domain-containing protein [Nocardioides sp. C4-1]|uniref:helix-turn-helix transcriptional regulator n=1 Tax=Nocardioides sp. C4-1 TaxID=3151851 RepID=UPI0032659B5B
MPPAGRDQLRPMQRLVRIMAVLDQAGSQGATREKLIEVADYGDADPGTQLAKDLRHLREQGWQIDNLAGVGESARYRMVTGDNRLRLSLTATQLGALQRAVIMTERSDLATSLGVREASLPEGVGTHVLPRVPDTQLSQVLQAVRLACLVRFSYKGTARVASPAAVRFQDHHWYLTALEDAGDVVKHFAVNRMSDVVLDRPGTAAAVPQAVPLTLHPLQWEVDEPTRVVVRTPADYVPDVERWLQAPDAARPGDGWVDLVYTVTNRAAFRSRLYVLGTRVVVREPDDFRAELLAELRALVGEAGA